MVAQRAPVLLGCMAISFLAGVALDRMLDALQASTASAAAPATAAAAVAFLVALSPMFNAQGGSGGGLFASRLSTALAAAAAAAAAQDARDADEARALAVDGGARGAPAVRARRAPPGLPLLPRAQHMREARSVALAVASIMLPLALVTTLAGVGLGPARAGAVFATMTLAISLCSAVAYYVTLLCARAGVDADNVGVPVVCATMDLVASVAFMFAATRGVRGL